MAKRKVLYVVHNHPDLYPGGAEQYALELYEEIRESGEFEPLLLARIGSTPARKEVPHPGTPFAVSPSDPNQYFMYTEPSLFDNFFLTRRSKEFYTVDFDEFLLAHQPDVVHFQHTMYLGFDLIRQARNSLPHAPLVYTLHEYLPICHHHGRMVRTFGDELCTEESARRCHECFPQISPQQFFMRKRYIQSCFSLVDLFVAPSRFLLERYVDWGLPREKIWQEEYGRRRIARPLEASDERPRISLGFFGQLSRHKGVDVLLRAMKLLAADARSAEPEPDVHLYVHGANLEWQPREFQDEFRGLLDATRANVTLVGSYAPDELPRLMEKIDWVIVPSTWWENSPLVIQEAFMQGRPVLCSDIGSMAEKVGHEVNGLHFRVGDAESLAATIRRATSEPGLRPRLAAGIPPVYSIEDHRRALEKRYGELLSSVEFQTWAGAGVDRD